MTWGTRYHPNPNAYYWNQYYAPAYPRPLPPPRVAPRPPSTPPDYERLLGEGLHVSQHTIDTIKTLMPKILQRKEDCQIVWYPTNKNYVFGLITAPVLIFKIAQRTGQPVANNALTEKHFAHMVTAKKVCMTQLLKLLELPSAVKFQVEGITIIAQHRMVIPSDKCTAYQHPGLEKALRQLISFIAKTGLSHIRLDKLPVNPFRSSRGSQRIILLNLDEMEGASLGIRALIGCLSLKSQINLVAAEVLRQGIVCNYPTLHEMRDTRLQELRTGQAEKLERQTREEEIQLKVFYEQNGIIDDERKPIEIENWEQLGLPLDATTPITVVIEHEVRKKDGSQIKFSRKTTQTVTLRKTAEEVIGEINEAIQQSNDDLPIKSKRCVRLILPPEYRGHQREKWITSILHALVKARYIFKVQEDAEGYIIQT